MTHSSTIIRFILAGSMINATDFGIYYLLFHFLSFNLSKAISFTCAGFVGYLVNKFWIFRYNRPSVAEIAQYVLVNFLALGLNVLVNHGVLNLWPGAVWPAVIIATLFTGLFVFICFKFWVFRVPLKDRVTLNWWKWFPWRPLVREAARRRGFLDPIKVLSQVQNFALPSEVAVPIELLRLGVVMHARGLINSVAIQHNLDWIWPYWVECQCDPESDAFVPRSFSLTQINLTHRNWTALGIPDGSEYPLVDPRGLVTPHYDGWSIDVWIVPKDGEPLIPSRCPGVSQTLSMGDDLCVNTVSARDGFKLQLKAQVIGPAEAPLCQVVVTAGASAKAKLVISLRPYNPEGVSFVNSISRHEDSSGWRVNQEHDVYFDKPPEQYVFSDYHRGDVYTRLSSGENEKEISCKVGMASSAAIYSLQAGLVRELTFTAPLMKGKIEKGSYPAYQETAKHAWKKSLEGVCSLQIPDKKFQFLYDAAIRTMILHSPKEVYPGPYIYKRFWFRDAAFILSAMLGAGLKQRVRRSLDCFCSRQTSEGYFLSQEGEWDSNGEALWIMRQYCEKSSTAPPQAWRESIIKAGRWISNKCLRADLPEPHAGLLPSGFSAEHLGPNNYYYWDDFWGVAGLSAAAYFSEAYNDREQAGFFERRSRALLDSIERSLKKVQARLKRPAMPASPYRRYDSGAVGSLAAGYPLQIFERDDPRLLDTAEYLLENCLVHGGFFHDMTHSGINPYLTLHLSQVLLRAGDPRYFDLMTAVAKLASPTGQWPESVHPRTGGGCMGDGQHVWAAAEWVLMVRNCFVREEGQRLILCSGIPRAWLDKEQTMSFGPAPTKFGDIHITLTPQKESIVIQWRGAWFAKEPIIDVHLPGFKSVTVPSATNSLELEYEAAL